MPSTAPHDPGQAAMPAGFCDAMRRLASSVMIVTTRNLQGQPHGMVASSVIPVSMDPPSMLVAVDRDAGVHPVLLQSRRCVNLLADHQHPLLAPFSQSALRALRLRSDDWCSAWSHDPELLPWLPCAATVIDSAVDLAASYGTHTLFVGRVPGVHCAASMAGAAAPLLWLAGQRASLATAPERGQHPAGHRPGRPGQRHGAVRHARRPLPHRTHDGVDRHHPEAVEQRPALQHQRQALEDQAQCNGDARAGRRLHP